jgi:hypothetical protein
MTIIMAAQYVYHISSNTISCNIFRKHHLLPATPSPSYNTISSNTISSNTISSNSSLSNPSANSSLNLPIHLSHPSLHPSLHPFITSTHTVYPLSSLRTHTTNLITSLPTKVHTSKILPSKTPHIKSPTSTM